MSTVAAERRMVDEVMIFDSVFMGHTVENLRAYYRVSASASDAQDEVFVFDSVFMGNGYRNTVENNFIGRRASFRVRPLFAALSRQLQDSITTTTESSSSSSSMGECSICLQLLSSGSNRSKAIIRMPQPCSHVYHLNCITHWLTIKNTCPLCRRIINL